MHITKVELENIKSHVNASFAFDRGTIAIMGSNGAGKTTIIEAVAWTLFDLLDYKKDDFARRGTKSKGIARVTFESSLDEREYTVYRDTGIGYYVYDPRLKTRIADKKEEVTLFIRQHLGVDPGTDLEALFRRAIGVPQGTFTAIFLETAAERKKAFDKLLKVEEYRQGADKLRETLRFVEGSIANVREKIARAEGELSRIDALEAEQKEVGEQIAEFERTLKRLTGELEAKQKALAEFEVIEVQFNRLLTDGQKIKVEREAALREQARIEDDFKKANTAAERLKTLEVDQKTHLASLAELGNLESQRAERDKIQSAVAQIEARIAGLTAEQKNLDQAFTRITEAQKRIVAIASDIEKQNQLEAGKEDLIKRFAGAGEIEKQIASLEDQLRFFRAAHVENTTRVTEAEKFQQEAREAERLSSRDAEITRELARINAALERDEKFQAEIKNGMCPILSEKCLNLKEGQTLQDFVSSQFDDYRAQIAALEAEQKDSSTLLLKAREAEKMAAALPNLYKRRDEIVEEGKRLKKEQDNLQKSLETLPEIKARMARIEQDLAALGNPKAQLIALNEEIKRADEISKSMAETEKDLDAALKEKQSYTAQLAGFSELEAALVKFQADRDRTQSAHREYLSNESLAATGPALEKQLSSAIEQLEILKKQESETIEALAQIEAKYDSEKHAAEKTATITLQTDQAEVNARLDVAKNRLQSVTNEIERLGKVRAEMKAEFQEKERLERVHEATQFIRDTLKEAAPRVALNYVYHVSNEANQLFREITGNVEQTLKWTEEYAIVLEEGGHDRPFQNLSGGEQMAAAMAVRLALLKQLSDVRLAFFDEPTTNMDLERRERLAEQISQIRHFDQLFVISHDDTFEEHVDQVVMIGDSDQAMAAEL